MNKMEATLIDALRKAGDILLKYFNKPLEEKVKESQSSIVTQADFASDSAIVGLIGRKFPTHNIISEESGFIANNSKYTWVIDPLDGTSNFASGIPWFGVLICLFENNIPVMGGAYLPMADILYFAEKGRGAFRNEKPLAEIRNKKIKDSLIAFSVDFTDDEAFLQKGLDLYRFIIKASRNIRSTNSLIDFLYVADGKLGGCINLYTKIWDISALGLIISEAGGRMINLEGNDLNFNICEKILQENFPVIAGSSEIVDAIKLGL